MARSRTVGRTYDDAAIRNSLDIAKDLLYHIIISEMLWGSPIVFQLSRLLLWSVKASFSLEMDVTLHYGIGF